MFLIVSRQGRPTQVLPLGEGVTAIGRAAGDGVQLDDEAVSPHQAELRVEGAQATLIAVDGTPGFQIGGEARTRAILSHGDEAQVGPFSLRVEERHVPSEPGVDVDALDDAFGEAFGQLFGDDEEGASTDPGERVGVLAGAPEADEDDDLDDEEDEGDDEVDEEETSEDDDEALGTAPLLGETPRPPVADGGLGASQAPGPSPAAPPLAAPPEVQATDPLLFPETTIERDLESLMRPPASASAGAPPPVGGLPVEGPPTHAKPAAPPPPAASAASSVAAAGAADPRPRLVRSAATGAEVKVFLGAGAAFIGSAPGMDITLDNPDVARRHAAIVKEGDGYVVKDLQTASGTRVNGQPIVSWRLRSGDRLRVAGVDILFQWPGQPAADRAASGPVAPAFADSVEDGDAGGRGRWVALAVGAVLVAATAALMFSPAAQRSLMGEAPVQAPVPSLSPQDQALLDGALSVAETLLVEGRFEAAERGLKEAAARVDASDDPRLRTLEGWVAALRVTEALRWDLWAQLARDEGKEARYALLMAEGRWHLSEADRANLQGAPVDVVERLVGRARAAFNTAGKLRVSEEEVKNSLATASRLVGRAQVREDEVAARIQREALTSLIESARQAEEDGQLRLAATILSKAAARAPQEDPARVAEIEALEAKVRQEVAAARAPLVQAGDAAAAAGRPVEAVTLFEVALTVGPEDELIRRRLTNLAPTLETRAAETFARAAELEQSEQPRDAWLLYRQVLEYVPDRTQSVYGDARARLEAMARAR